MWHYKEKIDTENLVKKILVLSVNPKNTSKLRLDEEVREIKTALQLSINRDKLQIFTETAVRVDDLSRALFNHQPHIVHFSGHGSGIDGLALEDNSGQMQLVSTKSLASLFNLFQEQVECVLLNACYSEVQATAIFEHIDYVLGMNQKIEDIAAIKFASGFYTALGADRPYEDCYQLGCTSIELQGIPGSEIPVIKKRKRRLTAELRIHSVPKTVPETSQATDYCLSDDNKVGQNRSVFIGGNVANSTIISGDRNVTTLYSQAVSLHTLLNIDIQAELEVLQEILANLPSPNSRKIYNAFADATDELNKENLDKDEVGKALERALNYAKKAEGFACVVEKLKPHLANTVAWLGDNWHKLLNIVGLGI
ncbi:MAG: CHAT domain-containing protein [Scytonematopsis contorta HA4267-MV1]|jgi:hypothetical protein|nr:CHAT domain-containing protein [Scytonematopsis contorta HA4267-MV1]